MKTKIILSAKYEVTNFDNGKTRIITGKELKEEFGEEEAIEMIDGYLPNYAVVKL